MAPKNALWLNFWNRSLTFWTRVKVKIQMNVRPLSNWSKNLSKHTEKQPIFYKKSLKSRLTENTKIFICSKNFNSKNRLNRLFTVQKSSKNENIKLDKRDVIHA